MLFVCGSQLLEDLLGRPQFCSFERQSAGSHQVSPALARAPETHTPPQRRGCWDASPGAQQAAEDEEEMSLWEEETGARGTVGAQPTAELGQLGGQLGAADERARMAAQLTDTVPNDLPTVVPGPNLRKLLANPSPATLSTSPQLPCTAGATAERTPPGCSSGSVRPFRSAQPAGARANEDRNPCTSSRQKRAGAPRACGAPGRRRRGQTASV